MGPREGWGARWGAAGSLWMMGVVALLAACDGRSVVGGPAASADAGDDRPPVTLDVLGDTGGRTDAGPDMDAADVLAPIDVQTVDAGPPPDVFSGCRTHADCNGNEFGFRACNMATNQCVECTADADSCVAGSYCDVATNRCARGCRDDESCRQGPGGGADGGVVDAGASATPRCNTTTRACVECTADAHCPEGSRCMGNVCVMGCTEGSRCPTGQTCCGGGCIDTQNNTAHCGACGMVCMVPNGEALCTAGACATGLCTGSFRDCDTQVGNGCETNTLTDLGHCGGCGRACGARPNTDVSCDGGVCRYQCRTGFADCNNDPDDGCEVELATSPVHCGACGTMCARANAASACSMGMCTLGACTEGFGNCDGDDANGCETDTRETIAHCGMCGAMCAVPANGTAACQGGRCRSACNPGFSDCDNNAQNGCETELATSTSHCGGCGNACVVPNATPTCRMGSCAIGMCNPGFADCNGDPADGCETNTGNSLSNCGACGTTCATPNATPVCSMGVCTVGACDPGFTDCDMMASNGCEINTRGDVNNCGACGTRCPTPPSGSASCIAGVCGIGACAPGTADCDGNPSNGCETNTTSSLGNCGVCGRVCATPANGSPVCIQGVCGLGACNTGFGDCDGNAANGCETNLNTNVSHCGGCGVRCAAPTGGSVSCSAGRCVQACPSGQQNCGGVCRPSGACTSAGNGGCQTAGTFVCSGTAAACSAAPRTSGTCATPSGGVCTAGGNCVCSSGLTNCSGVCLNLTNTTTNCGACGRVCTAPTGGSVVCSNGNCVVSCPSGTTNCSGVCRNLTSDNAACGACGRACTSTQACVSGVCVGQGSLRITLTWNRAGDMDLHVVPPCGTEISYRRTSACGGTLDRDDTSATGPENVFWSAAAPRGTYSVCATPYRISGTTSFVVSVVSQGVEIRRWTGSRSSSTGYRVCPGGGQLVGTFSL